jgi:hypothetical protein
MVAERQMENGNTIQDNYLQQTQQCLPMPFLASSVCIVYKLLYFRVVLRHSTTLCQSRTFG